ncbi:MAG: DUF362 domain-containing protein [Deltaproteobacteria bacterium]|nr:DUF362 domain-containing protein [Deltaproteobacteria bacterium]
MMGANINGANVDCMSILDGIGIRFNESMSGHLGVGESDPEEGVALGRREGAEIRFDVSIIVGDLGRFLKISDHEADLEGTVTFEPLGGIFSIREGQFNLFVIDPASGIRLMEYRFCFDAADGQTYFLHGKKEIRDDPGALDVLEDMTRLFTKMYGGTDDQAPVYAAGELTFKLLEAPALVGSIEVVGEATLWQEIAARVAFMSFAYGALRDEYLKDLRLFYDTQYENLVLSGSVDIDDTSRQFFLVSGVHDKGFPWGDGETFFDVLLALGKGDGTFEKYCITDRVLEGLEIDVEHGIYRYRGPLFALTEGFSASRSQMRAGATHLTRLKADFQIEFDAQSFDTVPFPFPEVGKLVNKLSGSFSKRLGEILPSERPLGMHITPHAVTVRSGKLRICPAEGENVAQSGTREMQVDISNTYGEAERSSFCNIKEPTLLYGYLCAIRPELKASRVQIHTRTLRDEKEHWGKDQFDAFLGTVVSRVASGEMLVEDGELSVRRFDQPKSGDAELIKKLGSPIIEVNNDHYPTAWFQRRIVEVCDPSGEICLALEEDMTRMRLEAEKSDKKAKVASIRGRDKLSVLDKVFDEAGFDAMMEERLASSGKDRTDFSIVIKPNFMFAYNKRDRTTYTDPELVGHLVKHLRQAGFDKIAVVEAQSTYGQYFDRRSVREMADYLGYDGAAGYEIVDMTEDATEEQRFGPHLGMHPVSPRWRDADARISFCKNKTHAYAFYTLGLKNIYGALPHANKFKEYHCKSRGIYHSAIEYLTAFPVHFSLVDAFSSADGPFGIFADTRPNETETIIGGADIVAVDWIAATKMGIDPKISPYMRLAIEAYGKPEIILVGDGSPYRPWLNVPVALTLFTHKGVDADYHFGNLMYSAAAQMDETHFKHKSNAPHIRLLRYLTRSIRNTFFIRTGHNPTLGNRMMSWILYRLGF